MSNCRLLTVPEGMLSDGSPGYLFPSQWWIPVLILSLLPSLACGRYHAQRELKRSDYFAQIVQRVDRRSMGEDRFFEDNLISNPDSEVRQWCAIALGRIGSKRALPLLYRAVHRGDAAVRAASAFAIGEIEDREFLGSRNLPPDPDASEQLLFLLDDPSITVQMRAIEALGKIGSHGGMEKILHRIDEGSYKGSLVERSFLGLAITALARLKDPIALTVLEKLANTGDPEIRRRASEALFIVKDSVADPLTLDKMVNSDSASPLSSGPDEIVDSRSAPSAVTDTVSRSLASSRKNSTIAVVETTRGVIEMMLFREDAPLTVADFVLTAELGNYDGFTFRQVIPFQLIEGDVGGSPTGFRIAPCGEINMRPFERGSVGLSFTGKGSPSSSLFIALAPQPYLDGKDTCFGRVISGMQVADRIISGDRILRIRIKETVSFLERIRY